MRFGVRIFATGRIARQRLALLTMTTLGMLGGCATMPSNPSAAPSGDGEGLYEGQPQVVYATEFPVESAADARERARAALHTNDIDRALYFYVQAVNLDPDDTDSLYMIGAIHERRGNRNLAARAYAKVVEIDPEHALALQGLGIAYFDTRETDLAKETLQRAVSIDATLWRAHNVLGVMADASGDHFVAIAHFDAALAARPKNAAILNNRGYSSYLAGDFAAAQRDFLAALAIDATYDQARRNVGLLHARSGDYETAVRELSQVLSRHAAANDVGYVAMLAGDYAVAENLFAEALRLSPRHYSTAAENLKTLRELRADKALLVVKQGP